MNLRPVFRTEAQQEFEEAAVWYEKRRKGLGDEFLSEIEALILRVSEKPHVYPVVMKDIRRAVADRFPYSVFFRIRDELMVVLAVFHARRNPAIWHGRSS